MRVDLAVLVVGSVILASDAEAQTVPAPQPMERVFIDQTQLAFIGIGGSKIKATRDVYQLATRVSDRALADKGDGRLLLHNDKGGVLRLLAKRQGMMLAADAVRVQLR